MYCACHTKGSRAAGPRPRARQLDQEARVGAAPLFITTHHSSTSHTSLITPHFSHHNPSQLHFSHHLSHTRFDTPSFTHHLSHTHTTLSPTIFDTPSFTPSLTHHLSHHFVTHNLSHTTLSHHLSHTALSHTSFCTPSFTHIIFHTQLCHTPSFLHLLLCLSFLPRPRYNISDPLLEEVDLSGPFIFKGVGLNHQPDYELNHH